MHDFRRVAAVALTLGAGLVRPAASQTPDQPNLIFTISAGMTTGSALWSIPRQLAFSSNNGGNQWDTVALGRTMRVGFLATLSATYFQSPHLGYTLEAGFFGLESESACEPVGAFLPVSASPPNQQACAYLHGLEQRGDAVGLLGGLTYRLTSGGLQPYLRAEVGGAILGSSFVEEAGPALNADGSQSLVYFLADQNHKELTWMVSLGAGAMLPLGPGYQLRVEARDIILSVPRPLGPATDTGAVAAGSQLPQPPIGMKAVHVPSISVGLDVVLERRRGRRY
ncbi:MAG TPA: hypothetical protein VEH62_14985 [Gemmatimonadales bacterium]|nr:hypothetical protein [Gemmatimonadales bacterium]